jgi:hypothetical protein
MSNTVLIYGRLCDGLSETLNGKILVCLRPANRPILSRWRRTH